MLEVEAAANTVHGWGPNRRDAVPRLGERLTFHAAWPSPGQPRAHVG
jgi:hypothetical protein